LRAVLLVHSKVGETAETGSIWNGQQKAGVAQRGFSVSQQVAFAAELFQYGEIILVALMGAWTFALWKNYSLTKRLFFRVIPFLLVIGLFALAFYSERFH